MATPKERKEVEEAIAKALKNETPEQIIKVSIAEDEAFGNTLAQTAKPKQGTRRGNWLDPIGQFRDGYYQEWLEKQTPKFDRSTNSYHIGVGARALGITDQDVYNLLKNKQYDQRQDANEKLYLDAKNLNEKSGLGRDEDGNKKQAVVYNTFTTPERLQEQVDKEQTYQDKRTELKDAEIAQDLDVTPDDNPRPAQSFLDSKIKLLTEIGEIRGDARKDKVDISGIDFESVKSLDDVSRVRQEVDTLTRDKGITDDNAIDAARLKRLYGTGAYDSDGTLRSETELRQEAEANSPSHKLAVDRFNASNALKRAEIDLDHAIAERNAGIESKKLDLDSTIRLGDLSLQGKKLELETGIQNRNIDRQNELDRQNYEYKIKKDSQERLDKIFMLLLGAPSLF